MTPLVEALRAIEEGHPAALRIATDALGHALTLFKKRAALSRGTVEELGSVLVELRAEKPSAAKKRKGRS